MRRITRCILAFNYYVSQIMGILPIFYNSQKDKVETNLVISSYCALMGLAMFCIVPALLRFNWKLSNGVLGDLHLKLNGIMCLIRLAAVLVTIIRMWTQRKAFLRIINNFLCLRRRFLTKWPLSEQLKKNYENSLIWKFMWGFYANINLISQTFKVLHYEFKINNLPLAVAIAAMGSILNTILAHFYFGILSSKILLSGLNEHIVKILNESVLLFKKQQLGLIKPAALMTRCCTLADELDDIALATYKLFQSANRFKELYDVQGVCIMLTVHLSNVAVIYKYYMMIQHEYVLRQYTPLSLLEMALNVISYYMDVKIFVYSIFDFLAVVGKTRRLLKDRQNWLPTLDVRLEESFKNFSLQLAKFPVEMKLVGLFDFDRSMAFSIFGSTISNAIVLMQYDYKHNYNK